MLSSAWHRDDWVIGDLHKLDGQPLRLIARFAKKGDRNDLVNRSLRMFAISGNRIYYTKRMVQESEIMPARFDEPNTYWDRLRTAVQDDGVSSAKLERDGELLKLIFAIRYFGFFHGPKLCFAVRDDADMRVKGGELSLEKMPEGAEMESFSRVMMNSIAAAQVFADHQHQKYLSQQGDVDMLQRQLAAADAEKTAVEKRLYAKFLCVLNEKKRKIHELEDAIEQGGRHSPQRSEQYHDEDEPHACAAPSIGFTSLQMSSASSAVVKPTAADYDGKGGSTEPEAADDLRQNVDIGDASVTDTKTISGVSIGDSISVGESQDDESFFENYL